MRLLRRAIVLTHRYLGMPLSVLFVVWFASGIVMMYARTMPALMPAERIERLEPIDFAQVKVDPSEALARSGVVEGPAEATLLTILGRPAYRFGPVTLFADTGDRLGNLDRDGTWAVATRFAGVPREQVHLIRVLDEPDQWTIAQASQLPLHRYRVDDEAGTELYVSPQQAEVVVVTTRASRLLAWIGAIPHWLYFAALRTNGPLWTRVMVWLSTLGVVVALAGVIVGVIQLRSGREASARRARGQGIVASWIPYAGVMRWHHLTGLVFGVFTLTWVFSGLLSMEPYAWTRTSGLEFPVRALSGGRVDALAMAVIDLSGVQPIAAGRPVKEVGFLRIHGAPYLSLVLSGSERMLVSPESMTVRRVPFTADSIRTRLANSVPDIALEEETLLESYDSYYYGRGGDPPLPVLRLKFADPAATWVYVDTQYSRVVRIIDRAGRVERWLYRGLHSLDFGFWYDRRPLWDVTVIGLSLGGLLSSAIGVWIAGRRLKRWARSLVVARRA